MSSAVGKFRCPNVWRVSCDILFVLRILDRVTRGIIRYMQRIINPVSWCADISIDSINHCFVRKELVVRDVCALLWSYRGRLSTGSRSSFCIIAEPVHVTKYRNTNVSSQLLYLHRIDIIRLRFIKLKCSAWLHWVLVYKSQPGRRFCRHPTPEAYTREFFPPKTAIFDLTLHLTPPQALIHATAYTRESSVETARLLSGSCRSSCGY